MGMFYVCGLCSGLYKRCSTLCLTPRLVDQWPSQLNPHPTPPHLPLSLRPWSSFLPRPLSPPLLFLCLFHPCFSPDPAPALYLSPLTIARPLPLIPSSLVKWFPRSSPKTPSPPSPLIPSIPLNPCLLPAYPHHLFIPFPIISLSSLIHVSAARGLSRHTAGVTPLKDFVGGSGREVSAGMRTKQYYIMNIVIQPPSPDLHVSDLSPLIPQ